MQVAKIGLQLHTHFSPIQYNNHENDLSIDMSNDVNFKRKKKRNYIIVIMKCN